MSDTGDDYDTAQKKLDDYFSPKKNVDFEVFQFRQAVQQKGETVVQDQFATRLRKIVANCEFHCKTPANNRLNRDGGYELPGCWIATMKKLGGGVSASHTGAGRISASTSALDRMRT